MSKKARDIIDRLRAHALTYPESALDFPWGECVVKVRGKVFVFLGMSSGDTPGCSLKLPSSNGTALALPFCAPTGYGLGKSGWVSIKLPSDQLPPLPMLLEWLEESYCAVAPKKLAQLVRAGLTTEDRPEPTPRKPAASKKKATPAAKRNASTTTAKSSPTKRPAKANPSKRAGSNPRAAKTTKKEMAKVPAASAKRKRATAR